MLGDKDSRGEERRFGEGGGLPSPSRLPAMHIPGTRGEMGRGFVAPFRCACAGLHVLLHISAGTGACVGARAAAADIS